MRPVNQLRFLDTTKLGASGRAVDTLEVTIDSPDPENNVGEIILRGRM